MLRQRRPGFRFHQPNIAAVEETVRRHILAEIRTGYRVAGLRFGLRDLVALKSDALRIEFEWTY